LKQIILNILKYILGGWW